MPERLQLSRRKGFRLPADAVNVARPGKWGNPFKVGRDGTAAECVDQYRTLIADWPLEALRGKRLACWCKPGTPCHADVLLELANKTA